MRSHAVIACFGVAGLVFGCHDSGRDPIAPDGQGKCSAVRPQTEPDLMAWDSSSRLNLKRLRSEGIVAVRYEAVGCNVKLEVLPNCIATGKYGYTPYSANERKIAHNATELYAQLPIGAANLTGKVSGKNALRTDYMLVGQYSLGTGASVSFSDLHGTDCERATHAVSAMYVGGFAMVAGASQTIDAEASIFSAGAGGSTSASVENLANEGNASACADAQQAAEARSACDVPLRLALMPIDELPVPGGECPSGMAAIVGAPWLDPFCLDLNEVTVKAYGKCVASGACEAPIPHYPKAGMVTNFCNWKHPEGRERHPINCITQPQAAKYCQFVSKRLPKDTEWKWAAGGGPKKTKFPWGDEPPSAKRLNGCGAECPPNMKQKGEALDDSATAYPEDDGFPETAPVRSFPAGHFGLFDMAGNVAEWTSTHGHDWRDSMYMNRSWRNSTAYMFKSEESSSAHDPSNGIGFRCAASKK